MPALAHLVPGPSDHWSLCRLLRRPPYLSHRSWSLRRPAAHRAVPRALLPGIPAGDVLFLSRALPCVCDFVSAPAVPFCASRSWLPWFSWVSAASLRPSLLCRPSLLGEPVCACRPSPVSRGCTSRALVPSPCRSPRPPLGPWSWAAGAPSLPPMAAGSWRLFRTGLSPSPAFCPYPCRWLAAHLVLQPSDLVGLAVPWHPLGNGVLRAHRLHSASLLPLPSVALQPFCALWLLLVLAPRGACGLSSHSGLLRPLVALPASALLPLLLTHLLLASRRAAAHHGALSVLLAGTLAWHVQFLSSVSCFVWVSVH